MNDARYAPPNTPVEDPRIDGAVERPIVVVRAVQLLWSSVAVGLLTGVVGLFQPVANLPFAMMLVITIIGWGISLAISYWLITAAWRGRGWSRWVQLVLLVVGVGFLIWLRTSTIQPVEPWYIQALNGISTLCDVFGIGMLFAPSANAWYRTTKAARSS